MANKRELNNINGIQSKKRKININEDITEIKKSNIECKFGDVDIRKVDSKLEGVATVSGKIKKKSKNEVSELKNRNIEDIKLICKNEKVNSSNQKILRSNTLDSCNNSSHVKIISEKKNALQNQDIKIENSIENLNNGAIGQIDVGSSISDTLSLSRSIDTNNEASVIEINNVISDRESIIQTNDSYENETIENLARFITAGLNAPDQNNSDQSNVSRTSGRRVVNYIRLRNALRSETTPMNAFQNTIMESNYRARTDENGNITLVRTIPFNEEASRSSRTLRTDRAIRIIRFRNIIDEITRTNDSSLNRNGFLWYFPIINLVFHKNRLSEDDIAAIESHRFRDFAKSNPKATEENCNVCLSSFAPSSIILVMKCRHFYHRKCIKPWLQQQNKCPTCRANVI